MDVQNRLYFEVFTLGPSFKSNFTVSLTSSSITYESKSSKCNQNISLDDVIGAKATHCSSGNGSAYIHIYSYPLRKKRCSKEVRRQRVEYVFAVSGRDDSSDNLNTAEKWVRCIKWLLVKNPDVNFTTQEDYPPRQKYLIFINPFGGRGSAEKLFDKKVKPMLDEADVQYEVKRTEHMGHAKEIIESLESLKMFDCIVCCSGDGIINEVINGLMSRPDWEETIQIPIGHIPCGSGNGMCAAALHQSGELFDMTSSVFTVLTGEEWPLDIMKSQTPKLEPHYSFLSIVFGIVADIDIESERYRYMGDSRFFFMALKKIAEKQIFSGKLWYLPVNDDGFVNGTTICESNGKSNSYHGKTCHGTADGESEEQQNLKDGKLQDVILSDGNLKDGVLNDGILDTSNSDPSGSAEISNQEIHEEQRNLEDRKFDNRILSNGDGILSDGKLNHGTVSDGVLGNGSLASGKPGVSNRDLPDFQEPIPDSWKVIEGDFTGILFISTSHIGKDVICAPDAAFGDGIIHCMCLSANMYRSELFSALTSLKNGEHVNVRGVRMLKARAFRVEPYTATSKIITIDGERFEWDKLQAEVYRGLARVRCRGPANRNSENQ